MLANTVKRKLKNGEFVIGTMMFEFNTTGIARLAAAAGAEFVVFDMEHTGWSIESIRMLIATTPKSQITPFVRIPATEYHFVARVLDMGAMGIMIPMCESEEQARLFANSANYPPAGRRGAAFTIAHDDYRNDSIPEIMQSANDEVLLLAQIETARGLDNVERIAAVPEIDVLWMGLFDLSGSLGVPGQTDHADVQGAIERVICAGHAHGKVAGVLVNSVAEAKAQRARGFQMLAYGGDLWLYQKALRDGIAALRS